MGLLIKNGEIVTTDSWHRADLFVQVCNRNSVYWGNLVMKRVRHLGYAFLIALLASCATMYQPEGPTGGFSETRLGENIWRVSFKGNGFTSPERATDFAMLRSAEVCLSSGYRYFIVAESANQRNVTIGATNTLLYTITRPSTTNTVICFVERPSGYAVVYDARFIVGSIRSKYGF